MAKPSGNLGTNQDLDIGAQGYARSYVQWVGGNAAAIDNAFYREGNLVYHNSKIWIASGDNENMEPGTSGTPWLEVTAAGATISPTQPGNPNVGDKWYNPVTGISFIYITSTATGTPNIWVQFAGLEIVEITGTADGGSLLSTVTQEYDGGTAISGVFPPITTELDGGDLS